MERISAFLQERERNSLRRALRPADLRKPGEIFFAGRRYVDLSANDYLGLSHHPYLAQAGKKAVDALGVGAAASRLLSGDLSLHHQLESKTAAFKGKARALVYNSGYQANLGIISALAGRGDVIFSGRLNHASIVDGIRLSGARLFRFRHNDAEHLEALLKKERDKYPAAFIITETIFSMDGDRAPLGKIVALKEKYNCTLIVDEAHATGLFGRTGAGVVEEEGLEDKVDLIMGTFSKALGSFGAYVAAGEEVIDYLVNTSRAFIYSTALPPSVVAVNLAGLDLVRDEPHRRRTLLANAAFFREELKKQGFTVKGDSQIVPLILGDTSTAVGFSRQLQERGYWVLPIRPPTVPAGAARLRFSLTYCQTREILEELIDVIRQI